VTSAAGAAGGFERRDGAAAPAARTRTAGVSPEDVLGATLERLEAARAGRRSAGLTGYAALTMAAALAAVAALVALVGSDPGTTERILNFVARVGPEGAASSLHDPVRNAITNDASSGVVAAVAIALAVACSIRYLGAFARTARSLGGPERAALRLADVPVLATMAILLGLAAGASVLTGAPGNAAVHAVRGGDNAVAVWGFGKWPLMGLLFAFAFLLLDRRLFNARPAGHRPLSGEQLAAGGLWTAALAGFGFYLVRFDSFAETFGDAGAAIVSLGWLTMFAVLYYTTPDLRREGDTPVGPGLWVAVAGFLFASAVLGAGGAFLEPFSSAYGAIAVAALVLLWLWATNAAIVLGSAFNLALARYETPPPVDTVRASPPRPGPPSGEADIEQVVRAALADDTAHHGMWSVLPGSPHQVPELLSPVECDLNDWGFTYGVAWAAAKARYPFESDSRVADRALGAANKVFEEYCAGENWSERLRERP
jgi:membrane protein